LRTELKGLAALAVTIVFIDPQAAGAQAATRDTVPAALVAEGKKIFEGKGGALCVTCHAVSGKGVTGLGPDLTDTTWLHGDGSLAFIEKLIKTGVMTPKKSGAVMPPMGGAALKPDQIKAVAAYVYSMAKR
jgi:mono/diheme cytochrome c family protein